MGARGANEIGEECREPIAHSSPKAELAEAETSGHGQGLRRYILIELLAAHHEDAALGSDAYAVNIGALELRCTYRLVHRWALVEVRLELLAFLKREVHGYRCFGRFVRVLRGAPAEREHPQRRGQSRCRHYSEPPSAHFRGYFFSRLHRVLL